MIAWTCGSIALGTAILACIMVEMRRVVLSLWVCSLSVGGLYLAMGAELLAVTQWIISTVIAVAFIFYAVMFGEYDRSGELATLPVSRRLSRAVLPMIISAAFALTIGFGAAGLQGVDPIAVGPSPQMSGAEVLEYQNVSVLGQSLSGRHFISIQVLALLLFLVVVGSGVIARPERQGGGK